MVFPTTLSLDKKMQSSRFRDSATSANDRVKKSGHILRSPLKSALKLFRNDGLSPHTKKGLLARPVKNKYKNQFGDVPFLRPNTGRAGGARTDGTTNPLDGFRGSLNGHDEVGESVPGEENGPNSADQYSSDEEDWDIDTAFSKLLQQERPQDPGVSHITSLTDIALPSAFANASRVYRADIVDTLLPTLRSISDTHDAFRRGGRDLRLSGAVVEFDDACKEFEGGVAERDGVMEKELVEIKVKMDKLFEDLKMRYRHREQLDNDFVTWIAKKAENARARVSALTEDMEDLITVQNKKSKALDKNDGGAKRAQEKMLRGLLMKM